MPPAALVKPTAGQPTKLLAFAHLVIDWINFLRGEQSSFTLTGYVVNGGMENDNDSDNVPDGWTLALFSGGAGVLDSTTSIEGKKSFKFTHPGGGTPNGGGQLTSTNFIDASEKKEVWLSWAMKSSVATSLRNKVELLWFDSNQSSVGSPSVLHDSTTPPTVFTYFAGAGTPPVGARYFKIRLTGGEQGTNPGAAATTNFDDVRIFSPAAQGKVAFFTTAGSFTFKAPPTCVKGVVDIVGAGGGGGDDGGGGGAAGGGAGAYNRVLVDLVPNADYTVVVGAGGLGQTTGSLPGAAGGSSSMGGFTVPGGGGGSGGNGPGGSGGVALAKNLSTVLFAVNGSAGAVRSGGTGGPGGAVGFNNSVGFQLVPFTSVGGGPNANGSGVGSGGGGSNISSSTSGNGAPGLVIIYY